MSSALKFHYSNPKFAGLPWPADAKKNRPAKVSCVKKPYTQTEAQKEAATLRKDTRKRGWFYRFCDDCKAFHVFRGRG
jgi:hypothetical protein